MRHPSRRDSRAQAPTCASRDTVVLAPIVLACAFTAIGALTLLSLRQKRSWTALAAAERDGIDAEIIDLKTLVPYDIETIAKSVNKTGRCIVAQEAPRTSGFAAELAAQIPTEKIHTGLYQFSADALIR
mgnify:CR=1 FL=1